MCKYSRSYKIFRLESTSTSSGDQPNSRWIPPSFSTIFFDFYTNERQKFCLSKNQVGHYGFHMYLIKCDFVPYNFKIIIQNLSCIFDFLVGNVVKSQNALNCRGGSRIFDVIPKKKTRLVCFVYVCRVMGVRRRSPR